MSRFLVVRNDVVVSTESREDPFPENTVPSILSKILAYDCLTIINDAKNGVAP